MSKIYLVILGNSHDPGPTWIGPMDSIYTAGTLNEKMGGIGIIEEMKSKPLKGSIIISPNSYRIGLLSRP